MLGCDVGGERVNCTTSKQLPVIPSVRWPGPTDQIQLDDNFDIGHHLIWPPAEWANL